VFKAFHALSWNEMSVRYEPVNRYLPPDIPGQASETTLDSGLGGAFLVSFLGDFLVLLAVLWHTHVLKTRGVWLSRDPDFLTGAASASSSASATATATATPAAASAAPAAAAADPSTAAAADSVGVASPTEEASGSGSDSGSGSTPILSSPGGAEEGKKKGKKAKARPLSWSPSLYRRRQASPSTALASGATATAAAGGPAAATVSPMALLGSGGGGGATPKTTAGDDDAAGAEEEGGRPSSVRSTGSAGGAELVRGESIATITSTTTTTSSSEEKQPPTCLTRVFGPFLGTARAKPGSDLYVSLFFIQCLLFLFVLFAYQQADHLVQSVRENQLSGGFILVLLLHFILIVVDRIIYLHRSIRGKLILQVRTCVCCCVCLIAVLWYGGKIMHPSSTTIDARSSPPTPSERLCSEKKNNTHSGSSSWSPSGSSTPTTPSASASTSTARSSPGTASWRSTSSSPGCRSATATRPSSRPTG
jgi:hypothetical protein